MDTIDTQKFPEVVYVIWDEYSANEAALTACQTVNEVAIIGNSQKVAIYKLDRVVTVNGVAVVKEAQES